MQDPLATQVKRCKTQATVRGIHPWGTPFNYDIPAGDNSARTLSSLQARKHYGVSEVPIDLVVPKFCRLVGSSNFLCTDRKVAN